MNGPANTPSRFLETAFLDDQTFGECDSFSTEGSSASFEASQHRRRRRGPHLALFQRVFAFYLEWAWEHDFDA